MPRKKLEKSNKPKQPKPVFPKMELPTIPMYKGQKAPEIARPSCEGGYTMPIDASTSKVPPPPKGKARILIGIPMLAVTYEFFMSFIHFWTELCQNVDSRYEIGFHIAYRKPVHMAEEYLVEIARYNKCTHILFMDDDIYDITKADLDKLFEADKDVIGGVMHASKFPHAMCVFRRFDPKKKVTDMPVDDSIYRLYEVPCTCSKCGASLSHWDMKHCPMCGAPQDNMIQRADLIPFAFTLIKTSVFDKIKFPWFHCTSKYPTDSWFADRLLEAGLCEYGHMGVRLNHAGITDATKRHFAAMGLQKTRQVGGAIELEEDQLNQHQNLLNAKMKEAEDNLRAKPHFAGGKKKYVRKPGSDMTIKTHGK